MPDVSLDQLRALIGDAAGGEVVSLRIDNRALEAKDLPTRIKLLNWGENPSTKGTIKVGAKTLAALPRAQKATGLDHVALDFNHNSVKGAPNYQPDPRKVAAYGIPEVVEGDGLYLHSLEWTPSGREYAKEYKDLSPTVLKDKAGEVLLLHSAALCPHGSVEGLTFLAADTIPQPNPQKNKTPMDDKFKKLIIALLGLADDADDAAIEKAAKAKISGDKPDADKGDKADKPDAGLQALSTEFKGAIAGLTSRFDRLEKAGEATQRDELVKRAALEGKVIPLSADLIKETSLVVLSAMIEKLPVTVPVEARTPAAVKEQGASAAASKEVLTTLSIDEERFKKFDRENA